MEEVANFIKGDTGANNVRGRRNNTFKVVFGGKNRPMGKGKSE